ncbi:MAG: CMP/dCMP deaminase zinc-binding protein [Rickettsiaceae bacterium]|jgi:tRNA(Arg) A34 adenosine deaminase TadA|nr:CMP/dCMP deaminase zinc-binding protein [Rickettsiaceae bacterium]
MFDNKFMQIALNLAIQAREIGEIPVGAVIVDSNNNIIGQGFNAVEKRNNALAHAEIIAIEQACSRIKSKYLTDCSIYVNLEPCSMCAAAISFSKLKKLYFGTYDFKSGGVENGPRFFNSTSCHHRPEIYGGIMESESTKLIKDFFKSLRKGYY